MKRSSTLVILLILKLPSGKEVKAQKALKNQQKPLPTVPVILLVSKLPAGSEVKTQLRLKKEKK
jgi:hypothetical protein